MNRRAAAWLLSIPLMLGGTEVAHWLAFRLVYPNAWERSQVLQQTGHGYLTWLPLLGGIGAAMLVSALFLHCREVGDGRGRRVAQLRLSQFAALPPLAFVLQEHLERLVHDGTVVGVASEPTFMLGLLLTLPFAAVAYLVARLLLRVAECVGNTLAGRSGPRRRSVPPVVRLLFPLVLSPPRLAALAGGHAERGPPL